MGSPSGNPRLQALSREANGVMNTNLMKLRELQKKMMMMP
jgi:hypothetical protein